MKFLILPVVAFFLVGCSIEPVRPLSVVPRPEQLVWHEMEMNAFVHFSINTFTDKEWGYGDESPQLFAPDSLDPDQWVRTFKDAGFKSVILTAKHHDGFCLWPTKYSEHSVKNSPVKTDVVKAVSEACKKYGLNFGIYLSPWDRNHAEYGRPAYVEYYRNQLTELFNSYGPVFEMWFDGANGGDGYYGGAREMRRINGSVYYEWPKTLDLVRSFNPEIIFFSDAGPGVRWVGNERGVAGETNWNTINPDTLFAGKPGIEMLLNTGSEAGSQWIPAETDVSIRPGWFYHAAQDSLVKSPDRLFDIYLSSVGRGSTLLLNVPPDRHGRIHKQDVAALQGFRKKLDEAFAADLAPKATLSGESRGGIYMPAGLVDSKKETFWATADQVTSGELLVKWEEPQTVKYVVLQEPIWLGQRVRSFTIEGLVDGAWTQLAAGTTIGYKRILKIDPVLTDQLRITIQDSKECVALSSVKIY
ncbi:MAG: alpha-L-fucosidase [Cyclobacteriaceae bacterium]|jgi:alpha-L-fucosidase